MARLLSEQEIDYVLEGLSHTQLIPDEISETILSRNKQALRRQLKTCEIYPEQIPKLKTQIEKFYFSSIIQPGESVGISAAQSIGERLTQNTLDSFHTAGKSEKAISSGVVRLQELMNATKKTRQKSLSCKIFFYEHNMSASSLRLHIGSSLKALTLKDLSVSYSIEKNKKSEDWYTVFRILYNSHFDPEVHTDCISFKLDPIKLLQNNISMSKIVNSINQHFNDLVPVCSFDSQCQLDIFIDPKSINLPDDSESLLYITPENMSEIYLEDCVMPLINTFIVSGISGINDVFYVKSQDTDEWFIETEGSNFRAIMGLSIVDASKAVSNNVWEIFEVLGIEAARQFLIEDFLSIMDGINVCHAMLLVERMTFTGTISSISRYTMRDDEVGPMGRASFEETLDNFTKAAVYGEREPTTGVSASIICGKRPKIGSGMISLRVNTSMI